MIRARQAFVLAALALAILSVSAAAQRQPYRVSDQQMQEVLNRIDTRHEHVRLSLAPRRRPQPDQGAAPPTISPDRSTISGGTARCASEPTITSRMRTPSTAS